MPKMGAINIAPKMGEFSGKHNCSGPINFLTIYKAYV